MDAYPFLQYDRHVLRILVTVTVLAGCGRISFDGAAGRDGGDAQPCTPVGHDEDSDGVDDACDVCPQLVDDQSDSDGDGVGDACDLHMGTRQTRALFDAFAPQAPGWSTRAAAAAFGADDATITALTGQGFLVRSGTPARGSYEMGGLVFAVTPGTEMQLLIGAGSPGSQASYYCELYDGGMGEMSFKATYTDDGIGHPATGGVVVGTAMDTGPFRIVFENLPPRMGCLLEYGGMTYRIDPDTSMDFPALTVTELRLAFGGVDATVDYYLALTTE